MSRCDICDHSCTLVKPSGPIDASVLAIGEKPGRHEAQVGKPFVGDAGRELDETYLYRMGVPRSQVRITNTVHCRLGGNNNKPTAAQIHSCASHWLPGEVTRQQPSLILLMGATACSLVPKLELDKHHGYPIWVEAADSGYLGDWEGWVVPMYHPAAGMHNTSLMIPLLEDFERVGKWLRGRWVRPERAGGVGQAVDYGLVETANDFCNYTKSTYPLLVGIDTENDGPEPWSLQFSIRPLSGRMILASNTKLIGTFQEWANSTDADWYMHNEMHDLEVLEQRMGVKINGTVFDTMQEAYHLGNLPQSLKRLAWRLLGVEMRDWEEVVGPESRRLMMEWLGQAWGWAAERQIRTEKQLKTKVKVEWKATELERAIKRIMSHGHKAAYNMWAKAREAGVMSEEGLVGEVGRWPIMSIANAPLEQAVTYGCEDAAVTLEVAGVLARERERLVGEGGEWQVA